MLQLADPATVLVDPAGQPVPPGDQCLVGDLHRRLTGGGVTVGDQQAGVDVPADRFPCPGRQLGQAGPPPGVGPALAGHDQTPEQLPDCDLGLPVERRVDLLGPSPDRPGHPPDRLQRIGADATVDPVAVQLGERELQQWQRTGMAGRLDHEVFGDAIVERHPGPGGRPGDGVGELGR